MNMELLENEIFKAHPTYTRFQVSTKGRVLGATGKLLTPSKQKAGYLVVSISEQVQTSRGLKIIARTSSVHRLVVETFIGSIPKGMTVDHLDGDKENNALDNLEIVTYAKNNKRAYALGLKIGAKGEANPASTLTEKDIYQMYDLILEGKSNLEIATVFKVHDRYVSLVRHGKRWGHLYKEHRISKISQLEKLSTGMSGISATPLAMSVLQDIEKGVLTNAQIAEGYGIARAVVAKIRNKRTWSNAWERYNQLQLATTIEMGL